MTMKKQSRKKRAAATRAAMAKTTAAKNSGVPQQAPALPPAAAAASTEAVSGSKRFSGMGSFAAALLSPLVLLISLLALRLVGVVHSLSAKWHHFYEHYLEKHHNAVRRLSDQIRASRLQSMALFTTLFLVLPMVYTMRFGVTVMVDGKMLGYAQNKDDIATACAQIERSASEAMGAPYTLTADVSYHVTLLPQDRFMTSDTLSAKITDEVQSLTTLSVVKIDNAIWGACATAEDIQAVLHRIEAQYTNGDSTAQTRFLQEVSVSSMQAPISLLQTQQELYQKLTTTVVPEQTYVVGETDTLSSIAREHNLATQTLLERNPSVVPESMAPGTKVVLAPSAPLLSVEVKKTVDYTEKIPFETIRQENAQLAENTQQTIQSGTPGQASVSAEITSINGVETDRTILSRTVLSDATDEIVDIGTKPSGIGSGHLISPISGGVITSGYKMRWGRMHKGIDYGASTGTTVHAADSGKVILSKYSNNGYGYYIILDHGNGMKTLYAHNSKLLVQVGDIVQQGQAIAYSGNTGTSTGPHCHFEVLIDNENVNPANYVS